MEFIGGGASLITLIDTTIKVAKATRAAVQAYANADTRYNELNDFGIQFSGLRLDILLPSLQAFRDRLDSRELNVNPRDLAGFEVVLRATITTLKNARSYLEQHKPQGDVFARLKWALQIEAEATKNIALVEKRLDLLSRLLQDAARVGPQRRLSSGEFWIQEGERLMVGSGMSHTQANYKPRGVNDRLVLEGIDVFIQACYGNSSSRIQRTAAYCQVLRGKNDSGSPFQTGFLPCIGVRNDRIVFLLPKNIDWKQHPASSMLDLISNSKGEQPKPVIPLERRLDLATQLSEAVLKIHLSGFVHSAIRSETILFLGPPKDFKGERPDNIALQAAAQKPKQEETVSNNNEANEPPRTMTEIVRRMSGIGTNIFKGHQQTNVINGKDSQKRPATPDPAQQCQSKPQRRASLGSLRNLTAGREDAAKNNKIIKTNKNKNKNKNNGAGGDAMPLAIEKDNVDTNGIWDVGPGHGSVYLVGWWSMQAHAGLKGIQEQDLGWHRAIYRHPDQWSKNTLSNMGHDIYSLGVCLLEIAMWESLLVRKAGANAGYSEKRFERSEILVREAGFKDEQELRQKGMSSREGQMMVKDALLKIADEKLPALVGSGYAGVVRACLTCLDDDDDDDDDDDGDGDRGESRRPREWADDVRFGKWDHDSVAKNCAAFKEVVLTRLWNLATVFAV